MTPINAMKKSVDWDLEGAPKKHITVGDLVSYKGKNAIVCRDRFNGMVDIEFFVDGKAPEIHKPTYQHGGRVECLYRDELDVEEGK